MPSGSLAAILTPPQAFRAAVQAQLLSLMYRLQPVWSCLAVDWNSSLT